MCSSSARARLKRVRREEGGVDRQVKVTVEKEGEGSGEHRLLGRGEEGEGEGREGGGGLVGRQMRDVSERRKRCLCEDAEPHSGTLAPLAKERPGLNREVFLRAEQRERETWLRSTPFLAPPR